MLQQSTQFDVVMEISGVTVILLLSSFFRKVLKLLLRFYQSILYHFVVLCLLFFVCSMISFHTTFIIPLKYNGKQTKGLCIKLVTEYQTLIKKEFYEHDNLHLQCALNVSTKAILKATPKFNFLIIYLYMDNNNPVNLKEVNERLISLTRRIPHDIAYHHEKLLISPHLDGAENSDDNSLQLMISKLC